MASSGGLGLNNDGDVVSLLAPSGESVDEMVYAETLDNIASNRSPDLTTDASFTYHHLLSPGRRADGSAC